MSKRRVVITGMGMVTPLGHDVHSVWQALLSGASGVSRTELFDATTFPTTFSAQVKGFRLADHLPNAAAHADAGRHAQFALAAAWQAWTQARLPETETDELNRARVGVYLGSGEGSLDFDNFVSCLIDAWDAQQRKLDTVRWAELAQARMQRQRELEQEAHMVAAHLAQEFRVRGPVFNVLTACAASTQAIGEATCQIRRGESDVILSGGAHSMIHPFGVTGFNRLTALSVRNDSPQTASRPFDLTRDGFVLGEGASILVLEELDHARRRGAAILAEVIGFGSSADAFRITDQDPAGDGAAAAMAAALADAGLEPAQVGYVSAHGTGTKQNDSVETKAMKQAFGEIVRQVPVSSVKSMLGHLIAAAGATELITCVLAMREGTIPPTANYAAPDPECDLDYVPNTPRQRQASVAMNNSFGFGGQNDSVIVRRWTGA